MRIHSKKTKLIVTTATGCLFCLTALAQGDFSPSSSNSSTTASPSGPSEAPTTATQQSPSSSANQAHAETSTSSALDYLFNRKPKEGSPAAALHRANQHAEDREKAAAALGGAGFSDPETAARFERFLGAAEIPAPQVQAYLEAVDQVHATLKTRRPVHAWNDLLQLSEFDNLDAGVSNELANRIESIWNLDKAALVLERTNEKLNQEIEIRNRNADFMSERIREEDLKFQRKQARSGIKPEANSNPGAAGGAAPAPYPSQAPESTQSSGDMVSSIGGKIRLTEEYLRTLEAKARIKMNEMRVSALDEKAKENFANYINTLFNSKRYLHVILAADFYRRIFNDSEYPVELANQVNASLEIVKDLQSTIEVFRYKISKGEIANATERLQEAFILGETHPLVLGVERTSKERVGDFASQLAKMRNLIEAREFGELETLVEHMKEEASDFDATKARAIVNAVKLESKLRLGKAKLAAQKGNLDLAMKEFQAAAEAWPANPELEASASQFFDTNDVQNQSLTDFDRDYDNGNYRLIFEKQLAYAPAMQGDEERQKKLKTALQKVQAAEMAIEKANILSRNGDHFGAWENVELAAKEWPEDRKLNQMRAELSGRSAEFVAAINQAKDAEARGELGYSLTWYLNAQRRYPASRISNDAIERLSERILSRTAPVPSSQPSTPEATPDDNARDAA